MSNSTRRSDQKSGVIISSEPEGPVQAVLDILEARGGNVLFIDPGLPDTYQISLGTDSDTTVLEIADGRRISVDADLRIWLRRPKLPSESRFRSDDGDTRRYQERVYTATWNSFFSLEARWMNDAARARALEVNKTLQSRIAASVGLATIPTLLTDNVDVFSSFVHAHDGDIAVKSPVSWHRDAPGSDDTYATYTRRLTRGEALSLAAQVAHAPVFSQPYIEKLYELRITVVGTEIFSCRIDSQASQHTTVDWRHYDLGNVLHESVELPAQVQNGIARFMTESGLVFAAIDMIVEPGGRHVFVEANPSGHYSWIEALTGLPISRSIADWLIGYNQAYPLLE
jgi:glutathione synthase/RimK-type ligase-like ATP-grasp enzyme